MGLLLHGSDTMSYSASALSFMLENLAKPVIFYWFTITDRGFAQMPNLITAIQIASLRKWVAVITEVCLYFEYKLYRGERPRSMRNILYPIIPLW
jgi:L-asparaginase